MKNSMIKFAWLLTIFNLYNFGFDWTMLILAILFAPYMSFLRWVDQTHNNIQGDILAKKERKNRLEEND